MIECNGLGSAYDQRDQYEVGKIVSAPYLGMSRIRAS